MRRTFHRWLESRKPLPGSSWYSRELSITVVLPDDETAKKFEKFCHAKQVSATAGGREVMVSTEDPDVISQIKQLAQKQKWSTKP